MSATIIPPSESLPEESTFEKLLVASEHLVRERLTDIKYAPVVALIVPPLPGVPICVLAPMVTDRDVAVTLGIVVPTLVLNARASACALLVQQHDEEHGEAVFIIAADSDGEMAFRRATITRTHTGAERVGRFDKLSRYEAPPLLRDVAAVSIGLFAEDRVEETCAALGISVCGYGFRTLRAAKSAAAKAIAAVEHASGDAADLEVGMPSNDRPKVCVFGRSRDVRIADAVLSVTGSELALDPRRIAGMLTGNAIVRLLSDVGISPGELLDGAGDHVSERQELALINALGALDNLVDAHARGDLEETIIAAHEAGRHVPRAGRNQPCLCGSGRKTKRCCGG